MTNNEDGLHYQNCLFARWHNCTIYTIITVNTTRVNLDTQHRRAYAAVYVRIRPYAEQGGGPRWPWSAFVIGWNVAQTMEGHNTTGSTDIALYGESTSAHTFFTAGLRWPWKFNMFELWRRQSAYARVCAGRNRQHKYKQLRRKSAYACVCVRMEYKPGLMRSWSGNSP